jgi:hypothetical protein
MCRWVPNLEALFFGIPENDRLFFIPLFLPADWPKQRVQLARLIYHEPALEVRFVRKAMGTTSFLTIWGISSLFRSGIKGESATRLGHGYSNYGRAKTTNPFAGMVIAAEKPSPCIGGPDAEMPPPFPAVVGFTQLSYTSLLKTSFQHPPLGKPIR